MRAINNNVQWPLGVLTSLSTSISADNLALPDVPHFTHVCNEHVIVDNVDD